MKRGIVIGLVCLVLLGLAGALVGRRWYENHPSAQFKRTILAMLDPTAKPSDIMAYLREARLAVRTRKDSDILAKTEMATVLAGRADELNDQVMKSIAGGPYRFTGDFYRTVKIASEYQRSGLVVPSDLKRELVQEGAEARRKRAEYSKQVDADIEEQQHDWMEVVQVLNQVRTDLRVPFGGYFQNMAPTYDTLKMIKAQNDSILKVSEDFMARFLAGVVVHGTGKPNQP